MLQVPGYQLFFLFKYNNIIQPMTMLRCLTAVKVTDDLNFKVTSKNLKMKIKVLLQQLYISLPTIFNISVFILLNTKAFLEKF